MGEFISEAEFNKGIKAREVLPWRDVPQNVIYHIEDVQEVKTMYGYRKVLSLVDRDGNKLRAYATSRMIDDLEGSYIKSLGLRDSVKNPSQSYYHYELLH